MTISYHWYVTELSRYHNHSDMIISESQGGENAKHVVQELDDEKPWKWLL